MKIPFFQLTLNKILLIIVSLGILCFCIIGYILLDGERDNTVKKWQMNTLQYSSSATSPYYASLIRSLVLELDQDVQEILDIAKSGENLTSIQIIRPYDVTVNVLKTCEVDKFQSVFNQMPTCFEYRGSSFFIYHELRSTGYSLGYLKKEIQVPQFSLLDNEDIFKGFAFIILCFLLVNLFMIFILKRFFIRPIRCIIEYLSSDHQRLASVAQNAGVHEIKMTAAALNDAFLVIEKYQSAVKQLEYEAKIGQLAAQLAHDIRSPLAALDVAVSQLGALPEENRILIRRAVQRIHDIANDLLHKRKSAVVLGSEMAQVEVSQPSLGDGKSVQLLYGVVEALVSEKRMQFRSRIGIEIEGHFELEAYGIFAAIQLREFKRVLSNLINNSVEALGENGRVLVKLYRQENAAVIEVADNGKGIPPEILPKLMQQGETHGKKGGSGLGLYHARMSVEGWGGSVNLFSEVGKGTSVKVNLPLQESLDWFVPELKINSGSIVVVIDDDDSIHEIWRQRFEPRVKKGEITLKHFSSPDDCEHWCKNGSGGDLYLCDYEFLNHEKNGVDLIRGLGIGSKSILVTSRFEEENVRAGCRELGVRLIPKMLAGFVPITHPLPYDAILLDDDDLVHMNWKMKARIKRKQIRAYTHPDNLYSELKQFAKDTPIYVDAHLGDDIRGEDVAKKLSEEGFANLFLATGYDKSNFSSMPWLKDIVGKSPPW